MKANRATKRDIERLIHDALAKGWLITRGPWHIGLRSPYADKPEWASILIGNPAHRPNISTITNSSHGKEEPGLFAANFAIKNY